MSFVVDTSSRLETSSYDIVEPAVAVYESRLTPSNAFTEKSFPKEHDARELLAAKAVLLHGTDVEAKREEIRQYFHKTFTLFEKLHDILLDDDTFYIQPERLRHPLIFYFGHTAVFFINKLNVSGITHQRVDPEVESMCAIGVDEMSWDDLNPSHYNWPSVDKVRQYRQKVRQIVDTVITDATLTLPITWQSPLWIVLMGIEHERIHLETSSVLFRQLPPQFVKETPLFTLHPHMTTPHQTKQTNEITERIKDGVLRNLKRHIVNDIDITSSRVVTVPSASRYEQADEVIKYGQNLDQFAAPIQVKLRPVPESTVTLGKSFQHHFYGWDNEYGVDTCTVKSHEASSKLISNRDYLTFMLAGGYFKEQYWSDEGKQFAKYKAQTLHQPWPVFWYPILEESRSSTTVDDIPQSDSCPEQPLNGSEEGSQASPAASSIVTIYSPLLQFELKRATSFQHSTRQLTQIRVGNTNNSNADDASVNYMIGSFKYRWLAGVIDMPWDWPVDINHLEAEAYANWLADVTGEPFRLPAEPEYKALQQHVLTTYGAIHPTSPNSIPFLVDIPFPTYPPDEKTTHNIISQLDFPFIEEPLLINSNISLTNASSAPVDSYSYFFSGFYDVIGNVWQHCASVIYPLPHFQVHPVYDDFTVPTYDNMHSIIAGGSWISTGNEACYHARYAFRRHFYQHAGARVVCGGENPSCKTTAMQSIEQDPKISHSLHTDLYDLLSKADLALVETPRNVERLSRREVNALLTARSVLAFYTKYIETTQQSKGAPASGVGTVASPSPINALVLGCNSGRLPIELARLSPTLSVKGIDTTVRLLGAGLRLLEGHQLSYLVRSTYEHTDFVRIRPDGLQSKYPDVDFTELQQRVDLLQTDVCNLPPDKVPHDTFNLIIVDCLERAYNPKQLLKNISKHSVDGCVVALCVYHQWSHSDNIPWGYRDPKSAELVDVETGITELVGSSWTLLEKSQYNDRVQRVNGHILSFVEMDIYYYRINKPVE